jgi:anti-sigma regulatory factor (Ser/Thr protein kinase)
MDDRALRLSSSLSELARVSPWIEELASRHAIPERTRFAMDLCLEEAISNIIRYGYAGESGHAVVVRYLTNRDGFFTLVVEDAAPPFDPLAVQDLPLPRSLEQMSVGGLGIHLLKQFADALEYERSPTGNRLILRFVLAETARAET